MKDIGYELHRIMEDNHMVKKHIAEKAGMSDSQLGSIRKRKDITCGTLERICKAMDISPAYFFDDYAGESVNISGNINNSSVMGPASVSVGHHDDYSSMQTIIQQQERLIQYLMKLNSLDDSVKL